MMPLKRDVKLSPPELAFWLSIVGIIVAARVSWFVILPVLGLLWVATALGFY